MISELQFLLAIQRAQRDGFHHFAAALVTLYKRAYPSRIGGAL